MRKTSVSDLVLNAVCAALMCVLCPLSIPVGVVPVSLASFVIMLMTVTFGTKQTLIVLFEYVLIGIIGLPVFAGFNAGIGVIAGPTGGFVIGYFLLVAVSGPLIKLANKITDNKKFRAVISIAFLIVGNILLYVVGTLWLMKQMNLSVIEAVSVGVVPFVFADMVKTVAAYFTGLAITRAIRK